MTLPIVEGILGLMLVLGMGTRWALIAGGFLMTLLLFGTTLKSDWATAGTQMIYVIVFYLLLAHARDDAFGVDARRKSPRV